MNFFKSMHHTRKLNQVLMKKRTEARIKSKCIFHDLLRFKNWVGGAKKGRQERKDEGKRGWRSCGRQVTGKLNQQKYKKEESLGKREKVSVLIDNRKQTGEGVIHRCVRES